MLTRNLLRRGVNQLTDAGLVSAAVDARLLLCHVLDVDNLVLAPPEVSPAQQSHFLALLERRKAGVALQLLTGQMYFRHLTLKARPGVFIVRPETETLVDLALNKAQSMVASSNRQLLKILDLCCGSGAVAIAMKTELAQGGISAQVSALDFSPAAIELTAENADICGAELETICADLTTWRQWWDGRTWDLIVSNPPYIPSGIDLPKDVLANDPQAALFGGGDDGMRVPECVIEFAAQSLTRDGWLLMEHDDMQGRSTTGSAMSSGFVEAHTELDLNGRDRFLVARRQG